MAKIYSQCQFYQEFLTMQGWRIFDTLQHDDDYFTFSCDYVGDDSKFDKTTSYDIDVYVGASKKFVVAPHKR